MTAFFDTLTDKLRGLRPVRTAPADAASDPETPSEPAFSGQDERDEEARIGDLVALLERTAAETGRATRGGPDANVLAALEAQARAVVPAPEGLPAQPESGRARIEKDRADAAQRVAWAQARLRDRRQELAACGERPVPPGSPLTFGLVSGLGLSLTFSLAWYEVAIRHFLPDPLRGLTVSLLFGLLTVGPYVVHELTEASRQGPADRWASIKGLIIVLAVSGGLFAARWCFAEDAGARMLAVGFTLLEVALALVVRFYAHRLGTAWQHHFREFLLWDTAQKQLLAEEEELASARDDLAALDEAHADLEERGAARAAQAARRRQLAERAAATVRLAYLRGATDTRDVH